MSLHLVRFGVLLLVLPLACGCNRSPVSTQPEPQSGSEIGCSQELEKYCPDVAYAPGSFDSTLNLLSCLTSRMGPLDTPKSSSRCSFFRMTKAEQYRLLGSYCHADQTDGCGTIDCMAGKLDRLSEICRLAIQQWISMKP